MDLLWIILLCGVASMVLGSIWFGPLFGKTWMRVIGADQGTLEERKKMQAAAAPLYAISFALALVQAYVLVRYSLPGTVVNDALWFWAGFIIPTVAAGAMWNNDSASISRARFGIQAGYYLVLMLVFAFIIKTLG